MKDIKVGVLGSGTMGIQLSLFFHANNIKVVTWNHKIDENFHKKFNKLLKVNTRLGNLKKNTYSNELLYTDKLEELSDCDIVIESIKEDKGAKLKILKRIDDILINPKVIATNTSTISINELAEGMKHKSIFIGTHFFNPILSLKLVEIIKGINTKEHAITYASDFLTKLGRYCVLVSDTPGFVVNRLLFLMINESINMIDEKVLDAKGIDGCMKLGANHNMGPLELADLIGLDVCLSILKTLFEKTGDSKYMPAITLVKNVDNGKLGKKSGNGFYQY